MDYAIPMGCGPPNHSSRRSQKLLLLLDNSTNVFHNIQEVLANVSGLANDTVTLLAIVDCEEDREQALAVRCLFHPLTRFSVYAAATGDDELVSLMEVVVARLRPDLVILPTLEKGFTCQEADDYIWRVPFEENSCNLEPRESGFCGSKEGQPDKWLYADSDRYLSPEPEPEEDWDF
ncbi:hypothetical protein BC830DRAFT_1204875 [Chytriomyces sp. MP71]|nr:hypothetical protein BC830DRAFT_1204875 [Chytriomyces sp. MP71]